MNKKSILERLQQKDVPMDREIVQVRVFRPKNIAITEALPDKDFSPIDFRNRLSDRKYQHETDVNVSIFKKIADNNINEHVALAKSLEMTVIDQCNPQDKSTLRGLMQRVINPISRKVVPKKDKELASKSSSKKLSF